MAENIKVIKLQSKKIILYLFSAAIKYIAKGFCNAFFRGVVSAADEFNSYIYAIRLKMAGTISSAERLARRQALAFQKPHWLTTPWLTTSNPPKRKFEEVEPQCEKVPPLKLRRVTSYSFPENLFEEDLWEVVN